MATVIIGTINLVWSLSINLRAVEAISHVVALGTVLTWLRLAVSAAVCTHGTRPPRLTRTGVSSNAVSTVTIVLARLRETLVDVFLEIQALNPLY